MNGFTQNFEELALYFQGGVRRSVLIFAGVCLVLLAPFYFLGQLGSSIWSNIDFNPSKIEKNIRVIPKIVSESSYDIQRSQFVPLSNSEIVLYSTINNRSNINLGYFPFVYRMQILDSKGKILDDTIENSYLLPGEVKYVVASTFEPSATRLVISPLPESVPIVFNPFSQDISKRLNVQIRNPKISTNSENSTVKIEAILKNVDLIEIKNLDILYLLRDQRDRVVGIGQYKFDFLSPGVERSLELTYPTPKYRTATKLDLRIFVNYLDKDNVRLPELIEPRTDNNTENQ